MGGGGKLSVSIVAAVFALTATGAVFNIKPGKAGLWNEATSYEEDALPQRGDIIQVSAGIQATANDADCEFINTRGVALLQIRGSDNVEKSSLTVTIANEETVLNCMIAAGDTKGGTEGPYTHGLIKEGTGRLRLAPVTTSGYANYDLNCNYVVNNGILQFPAEQGYKLRQYQRLTINSPGVAWMSTAEDGHRQNMYFNEGLCGDGIFSNTVSAIHTIRVDSRSDYGDVPRFTGQIIGDIKLESVRGKTIMAGTCTTTRDVLLYNTAEMYMPVFGGGTGGNVVSGSTGSGNFSVDGFSDDYQGLVTLGYLGTGQTAYTTISGGARLRSFTLDGGPNGGLDFAGDINFSSPTNSTVSLVLDGTNANECVLSGKVTGPTEDGRALRIVKRGSGIWRISENDASTVNGVIAVEEGTLKAYTLAQSGKNCSLGYSTLLQENYDGEHDPSRLVPYSILLGADSARGTLEYSGVGDKLISTRPIALAGEGALKSDGASLSWYGVTAAGAGEKMLVLDGAASGSKVFNVTNGPGKVSVIKEGSGSWTLGGTLGFTGGIDVREGTLSISSATNAYTWYRVMFRESYGGVNSIDVSRIGLFNEEGRMQCANLMTNESAFADTTLLQPGETIFHTFWPGAKLSDFTGSQYPKLFNCFLPSQGNEFCRIRHVGFTPTLADDSTRVGCVLRLPAGADPVTSYDIGTRWGMTNSGTNNVPQSWTVEGSVDGIEWVELSTVISNRTWTGGTSTWLKSGKKFFYDSVAKQSDPNALNTDGWEIASGIAPETTLDAGIDNLSVATNATVTADKTVTTRRITIDASGMGTASGFALAEGGVIDIVNAPETGDFEVDADLSGISLPSIYSLLVNGDAINKKLIVSPDDRKIAVRGYGFIMTLR